jgi:hypothetical protein
MTENEFTKRVHDILAGARVVICRNTDEFFAELTDIHEHNRNGKSPLECAWYIIHNREEIDQGEAEFG